MPEPDDDDFIEPSCECPEAEAAATADGEDEWICEYHGCVRRSGQPTDADVVGDILSQ